MNIHDVLRFSRISSAELSPDKELFVLHIDSQDDRKLSLEIPLSEFGRIVTALAQVAAHANRPKSETRSLIPIPLTGLGIAPSSNPHETLLMIQMAGIDLAFSAPTDRLVDATAQLSLAAQTLTAKGTLH